MRKNTIKTSMQTKREELDLIHDLTTDVDLGCTFAMFVFNVSVYVCDEHVDKCDFIFAFDGASIVRLRKMKRIRRPTRHRL